MDERGIWAAARVIVRRHGMYAEFTADRRVNDMILAGDRNGEAQWKRILHAVRDLQRFKPRDGEAVN